LLIVVMRWDMNHKMTVTYSYLENSNSIVVTVVMAKRQLL